MRIAAFLVIVIVGLMLYIRLAPVQPQRWHKPLATVPAKELQEIGGFTALRRITSDVGVVLSALEQRALATARTRLLAGSVGEGMLTFETRSRFWGFPDYTTVWIDDGRLVVHGRLRFGRSDLGVNKARILGWLESLGPLTEPL